MDHVASLVDEWPIEGQEDVQVLGDTDALELGGLGFAPLSVSKRSGAEHDHERRYPRKRAVERGVKRAE
ncbi:MAG: hypothetical protein AB1486_02820 [Planctomycetota bacterium]